MKKMVILVLMVGLMLVLGLKANAQVVEKDFTIDKVSSYNLEHDRGVVYVYKDLVGYKDKEKTQPIYVYVASTLKFELGQNMKYVTQKNFSDYNVFIIDGVIDTSWHNY